MEEKNNQEKINEYFNTIPKDVEKNYSNLSSEDKINLYIKLLANKIMSMNYDDCKTKEEKQFQEIKYLYNCLCSNVNYDFHFNKSSCLDPKNVFETKEVICGAIAPVVKEILTKLGISNDMIWGYAKMGNKYGGHVWNSFDINGKTYMLDCTFGIMLDKYKKGEYKKDKYKDVLIDIDSEVHALLNGKPTYFIGYDELPNNTFIGGIKTVNGHHINDFFNTKTYEDPEEYFNELGKTLGTQADLVELELAKVTKHYNEIFNNLPKEVLINLNLIYLDKKWQVVKNETPKGLSAEEIQVQKVKRISYAKNYIESYIKGCYGYIVSLDTSEYSALLKNISNLESTKNALKLVEEYKKSLKETYMNISSVVNVALPTPNLTQINAAYNRENQYLNDIVNGIFATSGKQVYNYILRANTGYMQVNSNNINLPTNPFNTNELVNGKYVLNKPISLYQLDIGTFEPVIDFTVENGKACLIFGQEWISRNPYLACKEKQVKTIPQSIMKEKNISVNEEPIIINNQEQVQEKDISLKRVLVKNTYPSQNNNINNNQSGFINGMIVATITSISAIIIASLLIR